MTPVVFDETDLPLEDLAAVGLVRDGRVLLEEADLKALLAGRRTDLLRMENLASGSIRIASIDAKLSLKAGEDGKPELVLHPIYREPQRAPYLTDLEAEQLKKGELANVIKELYTAGGGEKSEILIEFDKDTNQFLSTDPDKLEAPETINGQPLTPEQKARYKKGKEVELPDGTKVQYTATNREGLKANKIMLIASVVFDGGISFMLYHGLKALFGQEHDATSAELGEGYDHAMDLLQRQQEEEPAPSLTLNGSSPGKEHSRGYNRNSAR